MRCNFCPFLAAPSAPTSPPSCLTHVALASEKTPAEDIIILRWDVKRSILFLAFQNYKFIKQHYFPHFFFQSRLCSCLKKNRITISKWRIRPPTEKPWYLPGFLVMASFPLAGPINYFFKFSSQIEVADDTRQVESKMSFKLQHNF